MSELGIKIIGPVWDVSGISQCVRELAIALYDNGIEIGLVDMPNFCPVKPELDNDKILKLKNIQAKREFINPFVTIHYYPLDRLNSYDDKALANICYNVYETDRVPYFWKLILNNQNINEVWTASEFNLKTFQDSKIDRDKIFVINQGVDLEKYNPSNEKLPDFSNSNNFYFSYISEMKICKGFDVLLKAFFDEFEKDSNAKLIFKCTSSSNKQDIEKIVQTIKSFKKNSVAEVNLIYGSQSESFMRKLYATPNCFVLPTRGEGWCLPLIQSMASGVPVITTNCSAQTTYCNEKNSLLVDVSKDKIHDIGWLIQVPSQNEHFWWEPNYNSLRQKMRYAFNNKEKMKELGILARRDVEKFSWNNTAMKVITQIRKFSKK